MRAVNLLNLKQKGETNVLSQVRLLTKPKHQQNELSRVILQTSQHIS